MIWHCPACRTSGEVFSSQAVTIRQVLREHAIASPKCAGPTGLGSDGDIRVRPGIEYDESMKRRRCRRCGHESHQHSIGSVEGKPNIRQHCWHGRSLRPGSVGIYLHDTDDILSGKVRDKNLCECPGYIGPKRAKSHYNRNRSRWWRGGVLETE